MIRLPNPWVGGDLADRLPDDDLPTLVKKLNERFDELQQNFERLSSKAATAVEVGVATHGEPWHAVGATGEPAFQNSWQNYVTGGAQTAAFFKDPLGVVHLRGLVNRGASPLTLTTVFTLPVGYRPTAGEHFATMATSAFARVDVTDAGAVNLLAGTAGAGGTASFLSLAGITFRTT